jgi:hypothetical protein
MPGKQFSNNRIANTKASIKATSHSETFDHFWVDIKDFLLAMM